VIRAAEAGPEMQQLKTAEGEREILGAERILSSLGSAWSSG
jgi:hypothetical protein